MMFSITYLILYMYNITSDSTVFDDV